MPFVRISLRKELTLDTKNTVSKAVHESLIDEFRIPVNNYFHVIEELESHQLFFPESYLGISHTENIVFVQITTRQGRSQDQKKRLYNKILHRIADSTEILISDVIIILVENSGKENWSFGCGEIQEPVHLKS